jgi:hypothetical protein
LPYTKVRVPFVFWSVHDSFAVVVVVDMEMLMLAWVTASVSTAEYEVHGIDIKTTAAAENINDFFSCDIVLLLIVQNVFLLGSFPEKCCFREIHFCQKPVTLQRLVFTLFPCRL